MARTLSSVANLVLTFAEYSHSRWWAEFVGFAEDYLPLGDYLTLNLRAAKWPATPHMYLRDKWQIGGDEASVQCPPLVYGSRGILFTHTVFVCISIPTDLTSYV